MALSPTDLMDRALEHIVARRLAIVAAHVELGIPMDVLICRAVRQAFSRRVIDTRQQELPLDEQASRR